MSASSNEVVRVLQQMIASGSLRPKHEDSLQEWRECKDGWYAKTLKEQGRDAAEAKLTAYATESGIPILAPAVESTARGVLALAQADVKNEYVEFGSMSSGVPHDCHLPNASHPRLIVAFNPRIPGCGCTQPTHSEIWGLHGALKLCAITLSFDEGNMHAGATLGLYFAAREKSVNSEAGFSLVTIKQEGAYRAESQVPRVDSAAYLGYVLGMNSLVDTVRTSSLAGSLNAVLGFPGAEQYLLNHLGSLGDYLASAAERLSHHPH